ncbi:hypothetical protein FB451DRAFT_1489578 [Mycena latifolia]|nr:hypothetical protein FB451DRAFT_1489578 [Mycena latifolia]
MIFFFAGHGSRVVSPGNLLATDDKVEVICPVDERTVDAGGNRVHAIPDYLPPETTVILDSCHSGGMGRDGAEPKARSPPRSSQALPEPDEDHNDPSRSYRLWSPSSAIHVLLAACWYDVSISCFPVIQLRIAYVRLGVHAVVYLADCVIFAYGQTGSRKGWTVEGADVPEEDAGIYPNELKDKDWTYTMEFQLLEIYNETIADLLAPGLGFNKPPRKHEIHHHQTTHLTTGRRCIAATLVNELVQLELALGVHAVRGGAVIGVWAHWGTSSRRSGARAARAESTVPETEKEATAMRFNKPTVRPDDGNAMDVDAPAKPARCAAATAVKPSPSVPARNSPSWSLRATTVPQRSPPAKSRCRRRDNADVLGRMRMRTPLAAYLATRGLCAAVEDADLQRSFRPVRAAFACVQGAPRSRCRRGSFNLKTLTFGKSVFLQIEGLSLHVARGGYTGEDDLDPAVVDDQGRGAAAQGAGAVGARDSLRLEAGMCLYGNDLDEDTSPVEGGLTWVIGKERKETGTFIGAEGVRAHPPK